MPCIFNYLINYNVKMGKFCVCIIHNKIINFPKMNGKDQCDFIMHIEYNQLK